MFLQLDRVEHSTTLAKKKGISQLYSLGLISPQGVKIGCLTTSCCCPGLVCPSHPSKAAWLRTWNQAGAEPGPFAPWKWMKATSEQLEHSILLWYKSNFELKLMLSFFPPPQLLKSQTLNCSIAKLCKDKSHVIHKTQELPSAFWLWHMWSWQRSSAARRRALRAGGDTSLLWLRVILIDTEPWCKPDHCHANLQEKKKNK